MIEEKFDELASEISNKHYDFLNFGKVLVNDTLLHKMQDKYSTIVIIGFGASKLNIACLLSAVNHTEKTIIYIDDLNQAKFDEKLGSITDLTSTIFISISRSGNTQETYLLTKYLLSHNKIKFEDVFIICPGQSNLLYKLVKTFNTNHIEHDVKGSGRFGVLAAASLLIAGVAGLDYNAILTCASAILEARISDDVIINKASWYLNNYDMGKKNLVTFDYTSNMSGFLKWQSQLIAEYLGKEGFGITPVIACGTFDEHSHLQLYLEGPDDKIFKLITNNVEHDIFKLAKEAHFKRVHQALNEASREVQIEIYNIVNEEIIAYNIIDSILAIMLVAKCKNFDPFTQPAVDYCKIIL